MRALSSFQCVFSRKFGWAYLGKGGGPWGGGLDSRSRAGRADGGGGPGWQDWTQWKFDSRHSGDAAAPACGGPLGLVAAAAVDDALLTAPVVAGGRVYAVSASGRAYCFAAAALVAAVKSIARRAGQLQ